VNTVDVRAQAPGSAEGECSTLLINRAAAARTHHCAANCHNGGDDAVDLLAAPLLVRLDVTCGVLGDCNIVGHPPEYRMAAVANPARHDQSLKLLGGRTHRGVALSEVDDEKAVVGQLLRQLCRVPRIECDLDNLVPTCQSAQLL